MFIKSDGSLWVMGDNSHGQLGNGTYDDTNRPIEIVSSGVIAISGGVFHSLFLKADGSLWAMGEDYWGQIGDGFPDSVATPEQIYPQPQPVLEMSALSQSALQLTANCGFGGDYCLLTSTNLAQPLGEWTPVLTNSVVTRGTNNFSTVLTNNFNSDGPQFFILQSQ
jgi:hypothetical protein